MPIFFDDKERTEWKEQSLPGHISEVKSRPVNTKFGKATVVELEVTIGGSTLDKFEDGESYEGETLLTRGVFLYTDKAQSGLNRNYYQLCESLEVPIEEIEVEGKMMKSMPDIIENSNSVVGLPVLVEVKEEKWTNKEGEERSTWKAFTILIRDGGKKRDFDVPF